MPRAFHADAELETSASRDQLTERETPRLGLRTPPSPILPHPLLRSPLGAAAAFCHFAPCYSIFLDRSARDAADGVSPVRGMHRAFPFLTSSVWDVYRFSLPPRHTSFYGTRFLCKTNPKRYGKVNIPQITPREKCCPTNPPIASRNTKVQIKDRPLQACFP